MMLLKFDTVIYPVEETKDIESLIVEGLVGSLEAFEHRQNQRSSTP